MKQYNYAILVENTPARYLHQESTFLDNKFKKTKYAVIEKQVFKDGSEGINRIIYSNDLEKLQGDILGYISWYDYVAMKTKNIQQYITKLY